MASSRPSELKTRVVGEAGLRRMNVPSLFCAKVSVVAVTAKNALEEAEDDPEGTTGANRSVRPEPRRSTRLPSVSVVRLSPRLKDQPAPKGPGRVSPML